MMNDCRLRSSLNHANTKRVQEVLGTFLVYARAVDSTMLATIGTLAAHQTKGNQSTMTAITQFLNYAASNPDVIIRYVPRDMILHVESDASFLKAPKLHSRAAGYHYLSNHPRDPTKALRADAAPPTENGAINVLYTTLKESKKKFRSILRAAAVLMTTVNCAH
jgi:hypothetical protein